MCVTALDDRTLEVTLKNATAYWNELLAFTTYMPVREDVVADEGWATKPETYISNGRYTMTEWEHDALITIVKNENHWEAENVVMNEMKCFLSDDDNNVLTNWKNDTWRFIETYPTNEVESIKAEYPNEFITVPSLGTYFLLFNMNEPLLP